MLYQLRHTDYHPLATEQRGRTRLQRVRPLLQAARREPATGHAQGRHSDPQEEAEESFRIRGRLNVVAVHCNVQHTFWQLQG